MNFKIFKKKSIQFTDRKHPVSGVISAIIGIVSLIIMVTLFVLSGVAKGYGGANLGFVGLLNMIVCVVGFIMGILCFKKEDIFWVCPMLGSCLNGVLTVAYMVLYFVGSR